MNLDRIKLVLLLSFVFSFGLTLIPIGFDLLFNGFVFTGILLISDGFILPFGALKFYVINRNFILNGGIINLKTSFKEMLILLGMVILGLTLMAIADKWFFETFNFFYLVPGMLGICLVYKPSMKLGGFFERKI